MGSVDVQVVRGAWAAFASGDTARAASFLDPAVRWYGDGEPDDDGACRSRGDALAFMRRALDDGVAAELLDVRRVGDRLVATVRTQPPSEWGQQATVHGELVTVREGRITEIVVFGSVDEAVTAAER